MTSLEKDLVLGRLGQTRNTHKGSPTVLVEPTMDDAADRTGCRPDHEVEGKGHHESVMQQLTARLGLKPGDRDDKKDKPDRPKHRSKRTEKAPHPEPAQIRRPEADDLEEPADQIVEATLVESARPQEPGPRAPQGIGLRIHLSEPDASAQAGVRPHEHQRPSRKSLHQALVDLGLDLDHHEADSDAACEPDDGPDADPAGETPPKRRSRRGGKRFGRGKVRRKRRKHRHHKRTFRICSRTLRCLKAYSRVTGRWQYDLVGEALESYLELAITTLDGKSLENMRAILKELHQDS
jgi:hypothetical protein